MNTTTKVTLSDSATLFRDDIDIPVLLVAYSPLGTVTTDRIAIKGVCLAGRSSQSHLRLREEKISRHHFRLFTANGDCWIEDLGSTNGTFVNGARLVRQEPLADGSVIRAGQTVLVFLASAGGILHQTVAQNHGIAGRFHAAPLISSLEEATLSNRHILLQGPSGTGKELAAGVVAHRKASTVPFLVHNAAQFASEEEAATTLFGVESNVFTGVVQRKGVIEEARDGVLFLDETHNLPPRLQKSLLRVIENGEAKRIGSTRPIVSSVRFVLASNVEDETAGLVHDLYARMRVVRIPSLKQRTADIPSIFLYLLKNICKKRGVASEPILAHIEADHMETLCLDGFETENIRGLIDLADRIVSNLVAGASPEAAVDDIFQSRFKNSPVARRHASGSTAPSDHCDSEYEKNKHLIITAYQQHGGNISAVVRELKSRDISCSRRWLTHYIKKWRLRI